jgi:ATP-binding cassette subfamily G (WHITE) protein 2 (SNQ2)
MCETSSDASRSGLVIRCKSDEFAVFNPPSGQTCAAWAQSFVDTFGGYLDNPLETAACRYCQYAVGDQFYTPLNISFSNRWRDAFILFSFFGKFGLLVCSSSY